MSTITLGQPESYGGDLETQILGMDAVEHALGRLTELVPQLVGEALHEVAAEVIMPLARNRVPVKTGELLASSRLDEPEPIGGGVQVRMSFGGPPGTGNLAGETNNVNVDYAVIVHENLQTAHIGGEAKYLESAVMDTLPEMAEDIARRVAAKMDDVSG